MKRCLCSNSCAVYLWVEKIHWHFRHGTNKISLDSNIFNEISYEAIFDAVQTKLSTATLLISSSLFACHPWRAVQLKLTIIFLKSNNILRNIDWLDFLHHSTEPPHHLIFFNALLPLRRMAHNAKIEVKPSNVHRLAKSSSSCTAAATTAAFLEQSSRRQNNVYTFRKMWSSLFAMRHWWVLP